MKFIEHLQNYMDRIDYIRNEFAIEAKLKEKLPHILEFITGKDFSELSFKFYTKVNDYGCILSIHSNSFELTSIHNQNKKEFTCDIDFKIKISFMAGKHVTCHFDEDLNIKDFIYTLNFGSFGSNNSLYIENAKYFDGNYKRNIYLQSVSSYAKMVIENLNIAIHQEDREFEIFLAKILLINFTKPEFFSDAFNYLPVIDMCNTSMMSCFINSLHERYIRKDTLIQQSLELLDIDNF